MPGYRPPWRGGTIGRAFILVGFLLPAILRLASHSFGGLGVRLQVLALSPGNRSAFVQGSAVTLHCEWNAVIASSGTFTTPVDWVGFFFVDDTFAGSFKRKYEPNDHFYFSPSSGDIGGNATNEFHGVAETTWTASGVGTHKVACKIAQSGSTLESTSKK